MLKLQLHSCRLDCFSMIIRASLFLEQFSFSFWKTKFKCFFPLFALSISRTLRREEVDGCFCKKHCVVRSKSYNGNIACGCTCLGRRHHWKLLGQKWELLSSDLHISWRCTANCLQVPATVQRSMELCCSHVYDHLPSSNPQSKWSAFKI